MGKLAEKVVYGDTDLFSFQRRFPYERSCWKYLVDVRWPDGFRCPPCQGIGDFLRARNVFECRSCHQQTSATAGTLFHRSRIPLRKWFWAIFLIATENKGIPALYLQRQLGIQSYRAAWLMGQKIRQAMVQRNSRYSLEGTVQADARHIGGKQSPEERRRHPNKTPFLIMVEEGAEGGPRFVSFEELETIYEQHVLPALAHHVKKGSTIKSDGAGAYLKAKKQGYGHERSVYLRDAAKTQQHLHWVNILTSNLKRFLLSTHHGVHPKYRRAYLAAFAYRFNRRHWRSQAFDRLLFACITAHPITLPELRS